MPPSPSRAPHYLFLQGGTYYFRRRIPAELQSFFGRREYRLSLQTGYLRSARAVCCVLVSKIDEAFAAARSKEHMQNIPRATFLKILDEQLQDAIVRTRQADIVKRNAFEMAMKSDAEAVRNYADFVDDIAAGRVKSGDKFDLFCSYMHQHYRLTGLSDKYFLSSVGDVMVKAFAERFSIALEIAARREVGDVEYEKGFLPVTFTFKKKKSKNSAARERVGGKGNKITIAKAVEGYRDYHVRMNVWRADTESSILHNFVYLYSILGADANISKITKVDMRKVRDILLSMPKFATRKVPEGAKLEDFLVNPADEGERLAPRTVKNIFIAFNALFNWCVNEDIIEKNPCKGIEVVAPKGDDKNKIPFEVEDIEKIFALENYQHLATSPALFWVPILAYATGARREEISQLYVDDIKIIQDMWCMDINSDLSPSKKVDKRVKGVQSLRQIPIPGNVLGLGFVEYVQAMQIRGEERVFPELKKSASSKKYGEAVGRKFERYIDGIGIKRPGLSFHSLRHTFKQMCSNQKIDIRHNRRFVGHEKESGVPGKYGRDFLPSEFAEAFADFQYPVDISPLKALGFGEATGPTYRPKAPDLPPLAGKPKRQYRRRKTPLTSEELAAKTAQAKSKKSPA